MKDLTYTLLHISLFHCPRFLLVHQSMGTKCITATFSLLQNNEFLAKHNMDIYQCTSTYICDRHNKLYKSMTPYICDRHNKLYKSMTRTKFSHIVHNTIYICVYHGKPFEIDFKHNVCQMYTTCNTRSFIPHP